MLLSINNDRLSLQLAVTRAHELGLKSKVLKSYFPAATVKYLAFYLNAVETLDYKKEERDWKSVNSRGFAWLKSTPGLFCAAEIIRIYTTLTDKDRWDQIKIWDLIKTTDLFANVYPDFSFQMPTSGPVGNRLVDINRVYCVLHHGVINHELDIEKCSCGARYVSHRNFARKQCPMCLLKRQMVGVGKKSVIFGR